MQPTLLCGAWRDGPERRRGEGAEHPRLDTLCRGALRLVTTLVTTPQAFTSPTASAERQRPLRVGPRMAEAPRAADPGPHPPTLW